MRFQESKIQGVWTIDTDPIEDDRGSFTRVFCREDFFRQGLDPEVAQCGIAHNTKRGTVRGIHFQSAPHEESKLVRCTRGEIFDVVVDLRKGSATQFEWVAIEMSAADQKMIYVPKGCAHGYQTLQDSTEVVYWISSPYDVASSRGIRWDDPALKIPWPLPNPTLSQRDQSFPWTGQE